MTDEQRQRIHDITYSCDDRAELAERIVALEEENAKLRELARELWEGYVDAPCEECSLKDAPTCADCPICAREAAVIDRMRELGIEAE